MFTSTHTLFFFQLPNDIKQWGHFFSYFFPTLGRKDKIICFHNQHFLSYLAKENATSVFFPFFSLIFLSCNAWKNKWKGEEGEKEEWKEGKAGGGGGRGGGGGERGEARGGGGGGEISSAFSSLVNIRIQKAGNNPVFFSLLYRKRQMGKAWGGNLR